MIHSSVRRVAAALLLSTLCLTPAAALPAFAADALPAVPPDDFYLLDSVPAGPSGELLRSVQLFAPSDYDMWAILYRFLPDTDVPFRVLTPGAVFGVLLWIGISLLFGLYLSYFNSYDATYGALGSAIVFLIWLWLSNMALLIGAEFNDVLADFRKHTSADAALLAHKEVPDAPAKP